MLKQRFFEEGLDRFFQKPVDKFKAAATSKGVPLE